MSGSVVQGRKRKRSESEDPEAPHSQRSSPSSQVLSLDQEPSFAEYLPALPATPTAEQTRSPSTSLLPLTEKNLRLLDPTMPPKGSKDHDSSVMATNTVRATRELLRIWNHFIDDLKAKDRNSDFLESAEQMITGDRYSATSASSVQQMQQAYNLYKEANEDTFMGGFWPKLIKMTRLVKPDGAKEEFTPEVRDWDLDEVSRFQNQQFRQDCIVAVTKCSEVEQGLRDDSHDIAIPKPDHLYGFGLVDGSTTFSVDQIAIIKRYGRFTMPSTGCIMPWFLVEAKAFGGDFEEAVVQAARGGAVLCASFRRLDAIVGSVHMTDGVDQRSHVFSLAFNPTRAQLSVHYAEVRNGHVIAYHMHSLQEYKVNNKDDWPSLRRDIKNALEWGLMQDRKDRVKGILDQIIAMGPRARAKADELDAEEDAGRAAKRQRLNSGAASASTSGR